VRVVGLRAAQRAWHSAERMPQPAALVAAGNEKRRAEARRFENAIERN
jgi:hypothetical protein